MMFDCPEPLRRAIKSRAGRLGLTASDLIQRLLSETLAKELAEAIESLEEEGVIEHSPPKKKPGRKPKGG